MSARKGKHEDGGGHSAGWFVTFADLMSLLMAFFVMLVSFSNQDEQKLHDAAGSIRDAFGYQVAVQRPAGIIERDGLPVRDNVEAVTLALEAEGVEFAAERRDDRPTQGPEANTHSIEMAEAEQPGQFVSAATSLRQALADMPDIAELSRQISITETEEGLDIRLVDQDRTPMFQEGSAVPNTRLRDILQRIAPVLAQLPNRLRITGHSSAGGIASQPGKGVWQLSSERALAVSQILGQFGLGADQLESVIGKGDAEPLFPDDPFQSGNRRVDIVLLAEAPPLPPDLLP